MAFEDSFTALLRQYPDAVADKKKFTGLMKDTFPEQQKQVNLIKTVYDMGIADEMKKISEIDNPFAFRFVKRLMDEFGVSRANADWAVSVWCVCYGERLLGKNCEIPLSKAQTGAAPTIREETGSGKQYNDLFQFRAVSDGYGVCGFNGSNMRTLIFPNMYNGKPVTRILEGAFEGCEVQEAVMIDGITVIEDRAFQGCKHLKQVIFPGTLREIRAAAFSGCGELVTAALPKSAELIGPYAFAGTALKQVSLPDGILFLGEGAFQDCQKLTGIQLPKRILEIPAGSFQGCISLKKMELPEGIQRIGKEAFAGCTNLIDLIIPWTVVMVDDDAFAGMNSGFCLICTQHSAAEQYARKHNVPFQIVL